MAARSSKTIWFVLVIAGIAALVFIAAARTGKDRPVTVTVTHATREDLSSWIAGNGKIEPIDPHVIQSQLATRIDSVNVHEGQPVKTAEVLFVLDATDLKGDLAHMREQLAAAQQDRKTGLQGGPGDEIAQIESELSKATADIKRLSSERDSLQKLYSGQVQAATRQEVDQNRNALEKAQADKRLWEEKRAATAERSRNQAERAELRADEARESIQSLERKINSARVIAPADGTVYSLSARTGTFTHTGDTLAEMADLKRVRARAFIDEAELGSLKQDQPVEISWDALPARVWTGVVEQLPKTIVTRGSRNVGEVLCSVVNDEAVLLPNTNVNVRIRTAKREKVLTLPRAAVRSEGNKRFVFVVDSGHLRKREIMVGISDPTVYEIVGGITDKDEIALQSDSDLRDGQAVTGSVK
jgi:HlyD family secretion protein